ncbi:MFS transporter [Nonomuraea antimicrobica]
MGTWTARIPAVKERLGLGDGELSLALLAIAAGAMAGMTAVGRLVDRYGSNRVLVPAALLQGVVLVPPAYARDLGTLAVALLLFGVVHGVLDVAMNANAVEVERAHGRPIMSSFHAVFSVGGFAGATAGGLFAHHELTPAVTFWSAGAVIVVLAVWAARWALRSSPLRRPRPVSGPGFRRGRCSWACWRSRAWWARGPRPTGARSTCGRTWRPRRASPPPVTRRSRS